MFCFFLYYNLKKLNILRFYQGLLALEGELTPILVQMVKSANMNGLLDNESDNLSEGQQKLVF